MKTRVLRPLLALTALVTLALPLAAQNRVTTPEEEFGHELGADYELITYQELHDYWIKLAGESDRMVLDTIGLTEEGRPQIQAVISSPENLANRDRYREIAATLARAEGVSEDRARALSEEGKAVVWIDGGLHATELLGAQQLAEMVYRLNQYDDPETLRILDDVIVLATHANPDGHALVANWYLREDDPRERSSAGVPLLYNKYAGHDNNRDFYMSALEETTNMNRSMYREWYPQIVYNHHQTGPRGTIMFAPPFRDPPNHYLDPLILTSLDQVGSAMHHRFVQEGKGGTTMRSGAPYSTWWNGGLRTTPYFKNMIGLLTETQGHPNPITIRFVPDRQLSHGDLPLPVEPGIWHFRQSVEYSQTANWAVMDYASRNKDNLLFNIWRMGMNSIERGSRDSWTTLPFEIDRAEEIVGDEGTRADWERLLRDPADRDPRGFILPSDQRDFLTAHKFVNSLLKGGVEVHRATDAFTVSGTRYPAGSFVVRADQAFRPHVLDMFEKQEHPNDFAYPGGPPIAPYDNTGWTLAWQMDAEFDRILDGFDGPFEVVDEELVSPPAGTIAGADDAEGYVVDHINDAFTAVNRVLAEGGGAWWYTEPVTANGERFPEGAFYLEADRELIEALARDKGLDFQAVADRPSGSAMELEPVKIGLWDRYGGSMPSGWTRMILEDFEFDFELVFPPDLDEDDLSEYDVLVFEDGAIPESDEEEGGFRGRGPPLDPETVPDEYRERMGEVTVATTVPRILEYARNGGAVIAIGSSAVLAEHAGLPVSDHLVDESGEHLPRDEYFAPGSVLKMKVDRGSPLTHGLEEYENVLFSHSPTFSIEPGATDVRRIGWFDTAEPLRSGWAWGEHHLEDGVAAFEADYGQGKLMIFGPKITFRSQSHGTFPFLFNGIYYGATDDRPAMQE